MVCDSNCGTVSTVKIIVQWAIVKVHKVPAAYIVYEAITVVINTRLAIHL